MIKLCSALGLMLVAVAPALAQEAYPGRPITVVVPFAAGGGVDLTARIVGEHMSRTLGQQLIIENVGGAGGTSGTARVSRATPDGYTLLMGNTGTNAVAPALYSRLSYDPAKDFTFIGNAAVAPMVLAVRKSFPARTFAEFVKIAHERSGEITSGHAGVGSISHITCILLGAVTGAKFNEVPYRGSGPVMNDILSEQLDSECDLISNVVPHVAVGNVRVLAVADSRRSAALPDVPSAPEVGAPAFVSTAWYAMFGPAGLPAPIQGKLVEALKLALADPTVRKRFEDLGAAPPPREEQGPDALRKLVIEEQTRWTKVIRDAGVKPN